MAKKAPTDPILEQLRQACVDDAQAVTFLERRRWNGNAACPRCGSDDVYEMRDRAGGERQRNFRWRCRGCKRMFTVRTGTVMEESRLALRVWVYAFWKACSSKKGVSALQISRECEISYKSALFLMHRIREAMRDDPDSSPKLDGIVEIDETYVGGKPRYKGTGGTGRGTKKTPVFAMVQRDGRARARVLDRVSGATVLPEILSGVDRSSRVVTDELNVYHSLASRFDGGHDTIRHKDRVYAVGDVTTNTVESFFALIKRGVYGTFHSVSKHHLHRYVDEFVFRYNTRKVSDRERVEAAILGSEGKRLVYRQSSEAA